MRFPVTALSRFLAAAAVLAPLVSAGCASAPREGEPAAAESAFAREGVYIGLYGIQAYDNFRTSGPGVDTGNSDLGAGVKIGFRASPRLAVEVVAENVKGFDVSDGTVDTDLDILNFGVVGKYYLMEDRFQPYVLAGLGAARPDVRGFDFDKNSWFLRGGLGIDIYLTSNFAVFAEAHYNRMMGGGSRLHHIDLMAGVLFRF